MSERQVIEYPMEIGGRDLELRQLGLSILCAIKEEFPMTEVPTAVENAARDLLVTLSNAEDAIKSCIDLVRLHSGYEQFLR